MNTPTRECSWLESFPPDIWAYFACYLPGEQLGRLMMTGATRLWQRLKSPGVVKSIKLGKDFIVFKSFPRFLSEFYSLSELCIHNNNDEWNRKLGLTIDSIPSGVRKLELSGNWEPANTLFRRDGATLKLCEHLPHLEVLEIGCLGLAIDTWMPHSPQSLTKLKLDSWNGSVELPTSLLHFEAVYAHLSMAWFVPKLPPSLETFEISIMGGADLVVPLLPPSTRKLLFGHRSRYSDGHISPQNLLEQLPKSLTHFQLPTSGLGDVLNPEWISLLPSTLINLNIFPTLPCSAWHLLPPQLTYLSLKIEESLCTVGSTTMDSRGVLQKVRSIPFDSLPKSIRSLVLHGSNYFLCGPPIDCNNRSYFPPQLTYLDLDRVQLSPETAKLLPSSLTFLQIISLCKRVCERLPSSLKTLRSHAAIITPNLVKFLPKSLPSTLTELRIASAIKLGDTFLQHQQLPNLIQLDLRDSNNFTDLCIPLLPPHLTLLHLGSSRNISGKSFQFLPRSLTRLDLASSQSIFDSDVQHLPRTLKQVRLSHAKHLTDLCIPDLPPHLEWLDMRLNSQISTTSLPKFPYSLRSSHLKNSAIFSNWVVSYGATWP